MADSRGSGDTQTAKNARQRMTTEEVLGLLDNSDIDLPDAEVDDEMYEDTDGDPDFEASEDELAAESSFESDESLAMDDGEAEPVPSTSRGPPTRGRPRSRRGVGGRGRSNAPARNTGLKWTNDKFQPQKVTQDAQSDQQSGTDQRDDWAPKDYFVQYIDNELYEMMAEATNQTAVLNTGRSLDVTAEEMAKFFGINIMMGCLKYPRIRMYWATSTGVLAIKQAMSRNRFFKIRSNLKVVVDINVAENEKQRDKLWKVRPFLDKIKQTCQTLPRPQNVCVDEQMIPFTGHVGIRQHIRGKPYPTGLKNFVLAAPSGMVLDFEIFQGKKFFPDADTSTLSLGGLAVLRLTQTINPNTSVFVDRYFTSMPLLDCLLDKGITVTGTITKNLVPRNAKNCLKNDTVLKRQGRGSINEIVREDNKACIIQWYDNKTVLCMSSEFGADPTNTCRRWSKDDKAYIDVPRPSIIKEYNDKMGGVDLSDRMISYYRINARTKKWTVRTVLHMTDMSLVNAWLQEREDLLEKGTTTKHLRD